MTGEPKTSSFPRPDPQRASPLAKPITLSDLTEELLWPQLFRALPLALRPERLGIAFFTLVILSLLGRIIAPSATTPAMATGALFDFVNGVKWHSVQACVSAETMLLLGVTWSQIAAKPWVSAGVGVPAILVLLIGAGAISRMAACEFGQSVVVPWTRGLAFSISRWASLVGAVAGPLLVVGFLLGVVALGGGALFNWSISAILGALLYPIALILGALAVLLLLGFALGHPLIVPAVACEGTDAIDAAQRSYAYVVGRPLRLVLYLAILLALLVVSASVLEVIVFRTIEVTRGAAASLAGVSASQALDATQEGAEGVWGWVGRIVSFWTLIPRLLVGAFILSYGACGSTILYLLMRKLNDGQDTGEIWMPGLVGGSMAPVEAAGVASGAADEG